MNSNDSLTPDQAQFLEQVIASGDKYATETPNQTEALPRESQETPAQEADIQPAPAVESPAPVVHEETDEPKPSVTEKPVEPEEAPLPSPAPTTEVDTELHAMLTEEVAKNRAEEDSDRVTLKNVTTDFVKQEKAKQHTSPVSNMPTLDFDINDIKVVTSANPLDTQRNLSEVLSMSTSPAQPVVALKSGYRASVSAMNNNDKIAIRNTRGTDYEQVLHILKLLYSKLTFPKSDVPMTFDRWLKITAEADYETLVYGLYAATFPAETEYSVDCPHCRSKNTLKVRPEHLIEVIDQKNTSEYIRNVLDNMTRGVAVMDNPLVSQRFKLRLSNNIVVELGTSSLQEMLDGLTAVKQLEGQYEGALVAMTKYVKTLYVPNLPAFQQGKQEFLALKDRAQILNVLKALPGKDIHEMRRSIARFEAQLLVEYRLPKFRCANPACSKEIDTDVDMNTLLFIGIAAEDSLV